TSHQGYSETYEETQRNNDILESHGFADQRTMEIFKWMEWVTVRNQALSKVDDQPTHSLINTMPISSKALLRCMRHVATKVPNFSPMSTAILGARIAVDMGEKFGVLFDGWASGTLHFVAVYGLFSKGVFYIKRCLRSRPLNMDKELMFTLI
ncbi:hypothetical protein L917_10377, partial [Phytophthora nicotianae]